MRPPNRRGRRDASDAQRGNGRSIAHHGKHVRRLDAARRELLLVPRVDAVDERAIPLAVDREIRTEASLDERIDHVRERQKDIE